MPLPKVVLAAALLLSAFSTVTNSPASGASPLAAAGGVSAVAAGSAHTCAISASGGVLCWGSNAYGQLGDGTTADHLTPTAVIGLQDAIAIAAGQRHTCAVTTGGAAVCWGDNSQGQLGDGKSCGEICAQPVAVTGLSSGVEAVATGLLHSCALTGAGDVRCWGNNLHGQVGNNQVGTSVNVPAAAVSLEADAGSIGAGDWHSCAVTDAGAAKCWGENLHGQIGNGVFGVNQPIPASVIGLGGSAVGIAGGERHTCAVMSSGAVACWGRNDFGQLGTGSSGPIQTTPVDVAGLQATASEVAAGGNHNCAVAAGGSVWCWGSNASGELGDGTTITRPAPVEVAGLTDTLAVAGGLSHTCALDVGATLSCWGNNADGQLGDGTQDGTATPVAVAFGKPSLGTVLFASMRDGGPELYVTDVGSTGATGLPAAVDYAKPDWSPDGGRIAFGRDGEIYTMAWDGSGVVRLTSDAFVDAIPSWSPDGGRIAFQRESGGDWDVWTMNADGSAQTNLTNTPGADVWPTWSPDLTQLAFTSFRNGVLQVFVVNADGSGQVALAEGLLPAWSPDGATIAYVTGYQGNLAIYVMDANGDNETRITGGAQHDLGPSWSPDGSQIAFTRTTGAGSDVYTMHSDGSEQMNLTDEPALDGWPDWRPIVTAGAPVGGVTELSSGTGATDGSGPWSGTGATDGPGSSIGSIAAGLGAAVVLGAGLSKVRRRHVR